MKLKFGALVVDGRGKVGGHVASKNRAGAYLRTKVTPVNPQTSYQTTVRNRLSSLSVAWGALLAAKRTAWNAAVESFKKTDVFGDIKNPSGFNLYQRLNNNLIQIAEAQIDDPPLPQDVAKIVDGTLAAVAATSIAVTFATDPVFTHDTMVVDATPAVSPGKSNVNSLFRRIGKYNSVAAHVLDLKTEYDAKFGAVGAAGQQIFVRMKMINVDSGQAGVAIVKSCVIS
jgi:hypothetical protein